MSNRGSLIFLFLVLSGFWEIQAQILDDSTKQIYSQKTTFYFSEEDVINGEINQYNPDTTLNNVQQYNWQTRNNNLYQDLGNLGSPLFPVFYTPRRSLGVQYGIRLFDEYFLDPDEVRYFNTRSPFTQLTYAQGANNFANLNAEFSRNINPYLNVSFVADRFTSDKNLANLRRDRLVEHWNFTFHSNYRSKNGRYLALYHFSNLSHEVEEQGGINPLPGDRIPEDLYVYQEADVWLNDAFTWERRNNHHLYQHFKILRDSTSDFRIFHEFDRVNIKDRYTDNNILESDTFYRFTFYESFENTRHQFQYSLYENRVGLGGSMNRGFKYSAHIRHRYYYSNLSNEWNSEVFVGGMMKKTINSPFDSLDMTISGESQLPGDYRLGVEFKGNHIGIEGYRIFYSPDITQSRFKSNHHIWNNDFNRTLSDNLILSYRFKVDKHMFRPFFSMHRMENYIYYGENVTPIQEASPITLFYGGIEMNLQFGKIHFNSTTRYSISDGPDVIRFPRLFSKAQIYFQTRISDNRSTFQVGFEGFYRSAYFGNAYMPGAFQYYLQNEFQLDAAIVPDVFASFQFRKAQAFIKVPYFTQGWAVPGYFASPYYTGVQRPDAIALGFRWQFYD